MAKKVRASNGAADFMSPDMQSIREQVVMDELKARHWKAQYETAYYHLEFNKILPEYQMLLQKQEDERKQFLEDLRKQMAEGMEMVSKEEEHDVPGDPSENAEKAE